VDAAGFGWQSGPRRVLRYSYDTAADHASLIACATAATSSLADKICVGVRRHRRRGV